MMNKKGQAAAELAILGILILTAFSYIMTFGQSLAANQQTKMETFRKALQKAWYRNASVNYTLKNDSRMASPNSGFWQGSSLSPESSASVTWQKGKAGDYGSVNQSSFAFWQINNDMVTGTHDTTGLTAPYEDYGLPLNLQWTYGADGSRSEQQMLIPASVYKNNLVRTEDYDYSLNKTETPADITYTKEATLTDSAAGTIYTHFNTATDEDPGDDSPETPSYEEASSLAYSTSTPYVYESVWTVPHDTGTPSGYTIAGREERIVSIVVWDDLYWGNTYEIQQVAMQTRPYVQSCLYNNHPWIITNHATGGGYCDTSVTTTTVYGY